jgi:hypothetical protein
MKIVTFGSCLSRLSALAFKATRPAKIASVVYHNRADIFVNRWIVKTAPLPSQELYSRIRFIPGHEPRARMMFNNQTASGIGHHSMKKRLGFISNPNFFKIVQKKKVDLIVLDNYVDLVGKQLLPRNGEGGSVFMAANAAENILELYEMEEKRPNIEILVEAWYQIITWLRLFQPDCPIVFLNFPFHQHPSAQVARRSQQFANTFKPQGVITIPNMAVHTSLIKDRSHFAPIQYAMYAGILHLAYKNPDRLFHADQEDLDHILRSGSL